MKAEMWGLLWILLVLLGATPIFGQSPSCSGAQAWSPCDLAWELAPGDNTDNFELRGEFRSPHHRTYVLHAFRDEDRRYVIRFTPTEGGDWEYRLSSSLPRLEGQEGKIAVAAVDAPGFVHPAKNLHHFQTENGQPHLWMATAIDNFARMPRSDFDRLVDQRANEKFTHLRVTIDSDSDLREAADRVRAINSRGLVGDLVLSSIPEESGACRKYMQDIAARFSAMNITWMGLPAFEKVSHGRPILRNVGQFLKQFDPYDHLTTSMAEASSAAMGSDGWMNLLTYGTTDPNVGAVEHQLYALPGINTAIQSQRDLWTATMNGEYPASGSGRYMTAWFDLMANTRYWELEPYFDVDGGRAVSLEGVDYIVYIDKPGPVEVTVINHGYDVAWIDPATGERTKAKDYKGQHFAGEPPDRSHDWILEISREGHKQSLKSYKFDSRGYDDPDVPPIQIQEIESNPQRIPFDVPTPAEGAAISLAMPPLYSLKITRQTRATRSLLVEWTGEVTADGEGYRVIGTGREGTFHIPASIVHNLPASLRVRISILNANGKAYQIDKVYRLIR